MIFGVYGAMRSNEFVKLRVVDVIEKDDIFVIQVMENKTRIDRSFIVQNEYAEYVRRYRELRKPGTDTDRFFVNYQKGKCSVQPIGKNKFYDTPKTVATFLGLEDPKNYTGHSFRRTSATVLVDGGGDISMLKTLGGWQSSKTAEGYVDDSMATKDKINKTIATEIKKRTSAVLPISMEASTSSHQETTSIVFTQSVFQHNENNTEVVSAIQNDRKNNGQNDGRVTKFEKVENCTFNFYFK